MIKAILFMIKVGLFIAACLWIVDHPGYVSMEWLDYKVTIHVGFLLVLLFLISLYVLGGLFRLNIRMRAKQGYRALTIGLSAVAAGDARKAAVQSKKASKLLPKDKALTLLLKAQSARLAGNEEEAAESFTALLHNKDVAFLGVRGLLQAALDQEDYQGAQTLAYDALKLYPKQPWIVNIVYDLEIQMRNWMAAQKILKRLEKVGGIDSAKAKSNRVAILIAQADEALAEDYRDDALRLLKQAYRLDQSFVPTVVRLGKMKLQKRQRSKAVSLIEKAWKNNPHPDLAYVWGVAAPQNKSGDPMQRLDWFKRLIRMNEQSVESYLAAARVALEEGLWNEARGYLEKAEMIEPAARVYRLFGELEERSTQTEDAIVKWWEKEQAAAPDQVWVCNETGRIYPNWVAVAPPHGGFDTIVWDVPQEGSTAFIISESRGVDTLLNSVPRKLRA